MIALPFAKPRRQQHDAGYLGWVVQQPCLLHYTAACAGRVEADHVGPRGTGRRSDDRTAVPLCTAHHQARHARTGYFRHFDKLQMRGWCAEAIRVTQAAWDAEHAA